MTSDRSIVIEPMSLVARGRTAVPNHQEWKKTHPHTRTRSAYNTVEYQPDCTQQRPSTRKTSSPTRNTYQESP